MTNVDDIDEKKIRQWIEKKERVLIIHAIDLPSL